MHVIRRTVVTLAVLTIGAFGLVAPAGAEPTDPVSSENGPSVTVTPDSGLTDQQMVTVDGSGFFASPDGVAIAQCHTQSVWPFGCAGLTFAPVVDGSFSTPFTVIRFMGAVDCAAAPGECFVRVGNFTGTEGAVAPLSFQPDAPPPPVPETKDDCKNGGWQDLTDEHGQPFRNQGECTSFLERDPNELELELNVLDGAGNPFPEGTAGILACPVDGSGDCRFGGADATGFTKIVVDPNVEYRFTGFVFDTGWACPGFVSEDGTAFWFSDPVDGFGSQLSEGTTFVIHQPDPASCEPAGQLTVTVLDGAGNPFPPGTAGMIACPVDGSGDCLFGGAGADGAVVMEVDPNVEYTFSAFAVNTGWPCPDFVAEDGSTFHFSDSVSGFGGDVTGTTFLIHEPDPSDCSSAGVELTLTVLDGAGNPFPEGTAGMLACPMDASGDCLFGSADASGFTKIVVDPNVEYRFTGFVFDTGWACPDFVSEDGTAFWFSDPVDGFGAQLSEGTTFVIHEPDPSDCSSAGVELTLTVLDGAGNPFPEGTAGMIACPIDGSDDCRYGSADGAGVVGILVEAEVEYVFIAYAVNTGWPCPSYVVEDIEFHFSEPIVAFGSQLGPATFLIHEPDPSECDAA